ncbi:MAG TPA: hypothetical protein VEG63_07675, partial [Candidatus Acidoferrales bacterium]|nr:hypothetical protein [Candidatus Acidoferrales bacterium]
MNSIRQPIARLGFRPAFLALTICIALAFSVVAAHGLARAQAPTAPPGQSNAPAQLITVPPEVPADATRYTFLLAGNKAGLMAVWTTPDGARHNFFAFNDRGRGPAVLTRMILDRSGIPTQLDASGNDYLKGSVDEHFRVEGKPSHASWSNKAEKGEKQLTAPAFYVAIDASIGGELAAALLAAPAGRLQLLPEGQARIERVLERSVEIAGKKQTAILYEISGLGFTPQPIWLDGDRGFLADG